jgi:hypothetical protein
MVINQMGMDTARERDRLNELTKAQMEFVREGLSYYLGHEGREQMPDSVGQMPHEWGSMDTYDDMRNSMRLATIMLDSLLAPEMFLPEDAKLDDEEGLRNWLRKMVMEEGSICAIAKELDEFIADGNEDWWHNWKYEEEE